MQTLVESLLKIIECEPEAVVRALKIARGTNARGICAHMSLTEIKSAFGRLA